MCTFQDWLRPANHRPAAFPPSSGPAGHLLPWRRKGVRDLRISPYSSSSPSPGHSTIRSSQSSGFTSSSETTWLRIDIPAL